MGLPKRNGNGFCLCGFKHRANFVNGRGGLGEKRPAA